MPRRAIARRLVISQRTVDTHLRHAYARTVGGGPGARVRLVRWVLDRRP
jgi:DNA-binding NarL/FixJ family response regulator